MNRIIRFAALVGYAAALFVGIDAAAADRVDPVNKNRTSLALKGFDPVAYFSEGKPVKGSSQFTYQWMGATWQFASQQSRDAFAANPAQYAPQYGGYCSWAVSRGYTADTDPEAWKVVGGRLYLNYNKSVQKKWEADIPGNIGKADSNWPGLHK